MGNYGEIVCMHSYRNFALCSFKAWIISLHVYLLRGLEQTYNENKLNIKAKSEILIIE